MTDKKQYIRDIKRNIYVFGKNERLYIKQLSNEIGKLPDVDYSYLTDNYGMPKEIAESCLDEYDETELKRKFHKMKIVNYLVLFIFIIIFIMFLLLYSDYKKSHDSYIEREETIVEVY